VGPAGKAEPSAPLMSATLSWRDRVRNKLWDDAANPSIAYVLPFVVLLLFLALSGHSFLSPSVGSPLLVGMMAVLCWLCWPHGYSLRPVAPLATLVAGLAVFLLWIAPDLLFPGYRLSPLFTNRLLAADRNPAVYGTAWLIAWRFARAVLIVPLVEEVFWRAWLMRWLIRSDFRAVPIGTFQAGSFFIVATLFAFEHGVYWDVGLLAGLLYNWWMVRTKSLADCILAHAVTNACLSAYVIALGQWQYWS
jgi:uncharacterized protein